MLQDLHSHTYFSFCGKDEPADVIDAAISGGIQMLGICDHSYGIAMQREHLHFPNEPTYIYDYQRCINAYRDMLFLLKEKYADKIDLKCGIEIPTALWEYIQLPDNVNVSGFEYCLIEHIDYPDTAAPDLFAFAKRCGCAQVGIAHTDIPAFLESKNLDKLDYFKRMAEANIFWELNVNYDSLHGFRTHSYVERFFEDEQLQDIVRESGVKLSIGFDGHRVEEYKPERVKDYCGKLEALNIPFVFE